MTWIKFLKQYLTDYRVQWIKITVNILVLIGFIVTIWFMQDFLSNMNEMVQQHCIQAEKSYTNYTSMR